MNINQEGLSSRYLSFLLLFLFTTSITSLFWLPIFTDEVTWLQMTGKYLQHEGYDVTLTPQCSITHRSSPPFYMVPYRVLSSSFSYLLENPIYFRVITIAKIIFIFVLSHMFIGLTYPNSPYHERLIPVLMTFSMGGFLAFFVYLRPEVSILILTFMYLYSVFLYQESKIRPWVLILLSGFYLLLLVSVHQKAILLAPLVLIVLYRELGNKNTRYSILTLLAFSFLAVSSYKYYSGFFSCSQNSIVSNYWSDHGIPFYLLNESKLELFLKNISWRIQESHQILSNIIFVNHSSRNFPPLPDYERFLIPAYIASLAAVILLLLMLFGYFKYLFSTPGESRNDVSRKIYAGYFIFLAIVISVAQKENYFYESIVPLFFLSIFSWSNIWFGRAGYREKYLVKFIGVPCAIVCIAFLSFCSLSLSQEWKSSMYGSRHPKTFSHFNFYETKEKVNRLMNSKWFEGNDVWLVDELIATTLFDKKNIEIIHFSKIGVKSMGEVLSHANTNIGMFNCHYLKGFDLSYVKVERYEEICIVYRLA